MREIPPTIVPGQAQKSHKQLRVAAYCRVSTDSDEQEMSFEAQRGYYTDKIMRNPEWSLAGIFADEGISGTQASKRKEFMHMIRLRKKKKIDLVLTKSVSRFARNTVDCLNYIRELKALGIPVIFEKEGLNTMNVSSEIFISMHGIFAQSESESLSGNVRIGKQIAAKNGKVSMSYKSFLGYRKGQDGKPEIDPEEAETVRLIYRRFLAGDSQSQIKQLLEEKGIRTPMGKPNWTVTTIRSILSNEKYKGDALLQKTYIVDVISHKTKKNDDRPMYYVENSHPAIVSRETFDRVQEELARRIGKRKVKQVGTKTENGKYSSKFALTEILVCGCCGSPYRRCTWAKNGKKRIVWRCISRLDYGKKYCTESPTVDEAALQQAIVTGLCDVAADPSVVNAMDALKLHAGIYFSGGDSTAMDELRIKELVSQITAEAAKGGYSKEMAAMVQELNALKQRVAQKKSESKMTDAMKARLEEAAAAIAKLRPENITYSDDLVRQVTDCVRVLSADIPMDPETERMEEDFLCFPMRTHREEIWHWFDERHSKGVYYLLYERNLKQISDNRSQVASHEGGGGDDGI